MSLMNVTNHIFKNITYPQIKTQSDNEKIFLGQRYAELAEVPVELCEAYRNDGVVGFTECASDTSPIMRIKNLNYEGHRHCEEDVSPTWQSTFKPLILNIKNRLLRPLLGT